MVVLFGLSIKLSDLDLVQGAPPSTGLLWGYLGYCGDIWGIVGIFSFSSHFAHQMVVLLGLSIKLSDLDLDLWGLVDCANRKAFS